MAGPAKCIAILPWGNEIEDYLDPLNLSLDDFCERMDGGWLFGVAAALIMQGWSVVIIVVSARVAGVARRLHVPTGARVVVLPSTRLYRKLRSGAADPYAANHAAVFKSGAGTVPLLRAFKSTIMSYSATPVHSLARELRAESCTEVMVQEYEYARYDVVACLGRILRIPVFATYQGGRATSRRPETWVRRAAIRLVKGFVIGSAAEARRVMQTYGIASQAILRCPNPVDLRSYASHDRAAAREALALPSQARIMVAHCRIAIEPKGLDVLIEAWRIVLAQARMPQPFLLVVGDGPDAERFAGLVASLPQGSVRWHREFILDRRRLCQLLSAADAYVLSSRQEGFAVAPLEAMACGLPVVATDVSGIPDLIEDGGAAFARMVPRDNPGALANAISDMLGDIDATRHMGRAAIAHVERYAFEQIGKRIDAMLSNTTLVA